MANGERTISAAVDPDVCQGHGECVRIAPDVFTLNEDLTAECAPNQPVSMADRIEHAAAACPAEAISVTRTGS